MQKILKRLGFKQSQADPCVYYKKSEMDFLIIGVYVDDLLILFNNEESLISLKQELSRNFKIKDLGPRQLLGLRITEIKRPETYG